MSRGLEPTEIEFPFLFNDRRTIFRAHAKNQAALFEIVSHAERIYDAYHLELFKSIENLYLYKE